MISNKTLIKELNRHFIQEFKIKKPVILRFSNYMTYHGSYFYNNSKHYITLNNRDNFDTLCESLVHEIGHLLERNKYTKEHHSDSWGICFSRAYRVYLKWMNRFN